MINVNKGDRQRCGRSIRQRGNGYERQLAKEFRELGWNLCKTSRNESKTKDDEGVDLCNSGPISVQAKCRNNFASPINDLKRMPKDENYNTVFQKVVGVGEFVTMAKKDFYELLQMLKTNDII